MDIELFPGGFSEWREVVFRTPDSDLIDKLIDADPRRALRYFAACLSLARELAQYDALDVRAGLYCLAIESDYLRLWKNHLLPLDDRLSAVAAMGVLFEDYFALHCQPTHSRETELGKQLENLSEPWWEMDRLPVSNIARVPGALELLATNWWDEVPFHPKRDDHAFISVLRRLLARLLGSDALVCQESALYGMSENEDVLSVSWRKRLVGAYYARTSDCHPLRTLTVETLVHLNHLAPE
ncbi:MAG: hypothetical protein AB7O52_17080 [Planctomycetota bacterium]